MACFAKPPKAGLAVVAVAATVSACQTVSDGIEDVKAALQSANLAFVETRSGGPALPPAALPDYGVGDAFAFDNGRVNTVVAIDGARLGWDAGEDYRYVAERNFALPYRSWSWTRADGTVTFGTASPDVPTDVLWPLEVGNRTAYSSRDAYRVGEGESSSFAREWKCWVAGTEKVDVPAGSFDAFEIVCDRSDDGRWSQRTRWFYAPVVGHYVRRVLEFPDGGSQTMNLTAYGPRPAALPPATDRLRAATVQRALEKSTSNHTVTAKGGGYAFAVTPLRTLVTADGVYCRDYRQEISARGRTSLQRGTACRDGNGVWRSR